MGRHEPSGSSRGWGPFSGRQLTVLASVAIVSMVVMVPTAALAASGAFTSTTTAPAVVATNTSPLANALAIAGHATGTGNAARAGVAGSASGTNGVGIQGTGGKYGVYSNGSLGVSGTHQLVCTKCVTSGDIANRLVIPYNLAPGGTTGAIGLPANTPLQVTGIQTALGYRSVGSAALLRVPDAFIAWTGLESVWSGGNSTITSGWTNAVGAHVLFLDFAHLVDIQVNNANSIRIHNASGNTMTGSIVITW